MTNLINLVLIKSGENEKGKTLFKRLDTEETIARKRIDVLNELPIILAFDYCKPLPKTYSMDMKEYKNGADALLLEQGFNEEDTMYYIASYCRIKKNKQDELKEGNKS